MLKPEAFANEYIAYCQIIANRVFGVRITDDKGDLARRIAARDAEVREAKRKEVVADMVATLAIDLTGLSRGGLLNLASLQPPAPEPSERAMRVANRIFPVDHPWIHTGTPTYARTLLAEIIDAEFGAGK